MKAFEFCSVERRYWATSRPIDSRSGCYVWTGAFYPVRPKLKSPNLDGRWDYVSLNWQSNFTDPFKFYGPSWKTDSRNWRASEQVARSLFKNRSFHDFETPGGLVSALVGASGDLIVSDDWNNPDGPTYWSSGKSEAARLALAMLDDKVPTWRLQKDNPMSVYSANEIYR